METGDDAGAFHYNTAMDAVASSHASELSADARASQMINQRYDTMGGQQMTGEDPAMYPNGSKGDHRGGLSSDQMYTVESDTVPSAMETGDMYQEQTGIRDDEGEYATSDPNMDAYMMEQEHNQYSEYNPSQYEEAQYANGEQFNPIAEQMEDNQTVSDPSRSNTETLH